MPEKGLQKLQRQQEGGGSTHARVLIGGQSEISPQFQGRILQKKIPKRRKRGFRAWVFPEYQNADESVHVYCI
jgi:hypothetical protein